MRVGGLVAGTAAVLLGLSAVAVDTRAGRTAAATDADPCASGDAIGCLGATLATEAENDSFGGVVVIGRDGEPALAEGYGQQAGGDAYTGDTAFEIASLGKMFTAVAIGQLVDAGELALDDRAGDHVADLPAGVADATIAQLLSHTSGLGDSIEEGIVGEPGTHLYTNAGFDVLASIVEAVSGQTFSDYLAEHVFTPAGMADTVLEVRADDGSPIGWGGERTTGPDLLRFSDALLENRLLQPATTELFTAPVAETPGGSHYGYGFEIWGDPGAHHSIGHFGAFDLFLGWVNIDPDQGLTMIALCDRGCDAMGGPVITFLEEAGIPF
jgi:CubicO group peptidase (beta-lactamase class C family)